MLLYLHGFNSSPDSVKAQQLAQYLRAHHPNEPLAIPNLATDPLAVQSQIVSLARSALNVGEPLRLVGSSLGGYLSTYLLETLSAEYATTQIKAVLINPAVRPYELLADWLGEHQNPYTGERFWVKAEHMGQLQALDQPHLSHAEHYMVLLQTADEVLDYRQAAAKYQGSHLEISAGGDHSYQGFEQKLPEIMAFLGLA